MGEPTPKPFKENLLLWCQDIQEKITIIPLQWSASEENKKADLNGAHHSVEQVENPGCSLPFLLADLQYFGGGLEEVAGGGGHEKQGEAGEADGKSDFEKAKPVVESRLVDCVLEEKSVAELQRKKRRDEGDLEKNANVNQ